jgi:hypothetical protein
MTAGSAKCPHQPITGERPDKFRGPAAVFVDRNPYLAASQHNVCFSLKGRHLSSRLRCRLWVEAV